ncbi:MAG: SRPBCC domain-containing protein [Pseudomonadota bacterium]
MTFHTAELKFERSFDISPSRLWHLLTDGEMREAWGAPSEDMVLHMEVSDLREGGFERHRCGPKENPEFIIETRWYKLVDQEGACYSETLLIGEESHFTSLVTYGLSQTESGTDLDVTVAVTAFGEEGMIGEVQGGWEGGLASLVKLAAAENAPA